VNNPQYPYRITVRLTEKEYKKLQQEPGTISGIIRAIIRAYLNV
jgi:hypothetical protein